MKKSFKVRISFKMVIGSIFPSITLAAVFYLLFLTRFHGILFDIYFGIILIAAGLPFLIIIKRFIKGELSIEEDGLKTKEGFIKFSGIRKILISDGKKWQKIIKAGDINIVGENISAEIRNIDNPEKLSEIIEEFIKEY